MLFKENRTDFVKEISLFYIEVEGATMRSTAQNFSISKTLVSLMLNKELQKIDSVLFRKARMKTKDNLRARAHRGGLAFKLKRQRLKEEQNNGNC